MANITDRLFRKLAAFREDQQGATMVEYGLLISIISGALILGLGDVRDGLIDVLEFVAETFANANV